MSGTGASTAGRYSFGPGSELKHHQPPTNRGTRPVRARPTATITNHQPKEFDAVWRDGIETGRFTFAEVYR